jgi:hypothetical protein
MVDYRELDETNPSGRHDRTRVSQRYAILLKRCVDCIPFSLIIPPVGHRIVEVEVRDQRKDNISEPDADAQDAEDQAEYDAERVIDERADDEAFDCPFYPLRHRCSSNLPERRPFLSSLFKVEEVDNIIVIKIGQTPCPDIK